MTKQYHIIWFSTCLNLVKLLRCCSGLKLLTHFLFGNHECFWMYKHSTCLTWQISTVFFWWLSLPATHFTSIYRITVLHILHFIPRVKDLHQLLYTVPFTLKAASFMGGLQPRWPLVLRSLQLPHAFYTSRYLEIIAVLHYNNHDGVFHACALKSVWKSLYFIKVQ